MQARSCLRVSEVMCDSVGAYRLGALKYFSLQKGGPSRKNFGLSITNCDLITEIS